MIKSKFLYTDYSDYRFTVSKASGSYIWDYDGKKYIDFTSGWNVTNLGWNNPEVAEAVIQQTKKNVYVPMWSADPIQEEYAEALTRSLPSEFDVCIRATGGTEANEEALKIARAATGRKKIIGFADTYHGQSFGAMSIGYRPAYVEAISPLVPEFIQLEYPRTQKDKKDEEVLADFLENLEEVLSHKDVAAIMTEPGMITGWGSTLVAPSGFLTQLRKLTKQYGTLLILDEVGTGFSRLGKLFAFEIEDVVPDIITLAKGISNGAAAIGACVTSSSLVEPVISQTNLTSTFGWTSVACAAALKTLQIHKRDKVWEKAKENGEYLMEKLKNGLKDKTSVVDIRGIGMEIGIEFMKENKVVLDVVNKAFESGLHVTHDTESVIQLMPPLTISKEDIDQAVEIIVSSAN